MALRRKTEPTRTEAPLTLGFFGGAECDPKTFIPLLDDLVTDREVNMIFVPVSPDDYLSEIRQVVAWAEEHKYPISTVSTENPSTDPVCQTVLDNDYDDYDAGDDTPAALIELLLNTDDSDGSLVVQDGRLIVFYADSEGNTDDRTMDAALAAVEKGLPTYDISNGLDLMTAEEDEDGALEDAEALQDATPEPQPTRKAAPPVEQTSSAHSREDLSAWTTVELKKLAKESDPERNTTETLRGKDKDFIIDRILEGGTPGVRLDDSGVDEPDPVVAEEVEQIVENAEQPDEAQQEEPVRRSRAAMKKAAEEAKTGPIIDVTVVNTPTWEPLPEGAITWVDDRDDSAITLDVLTQALAVALAQAMTPLAEHIIAEVRKPKPRGRPAKSE